MLHVVVVVVVVARRNIREKHTVIIMPHGARARVTSCDDSEGYTLVPTVPRIHE